ncbi:MAG: hypothetical protein WA160_03090 [Pseudobdellovibrio sp.]
MKYVLILKKWALITLVGLTFFWIFFANWSFVFKQKIVGEVVAAERVSGALTVITDSNSKINPQVFSFSVAIKDQRTGEIHMASSEDRQWAAVSKGNCVIAAFFPYPPWRILDKGMTNKNARLLRNFTGCDQVPKEDGFFDKLKFFFLAY